MIEEHSEMSGDDAFGVALGREEPWPTAVAWIGALVCDDHLAEYLTGDELLAEAGDLDGLRAVLPPLAVLAEIRGPIVTVPVCLDCEAVVLRVGPWVVSVTVERGEFGWRVIAVTTDRIEGA
jgi:hypothetical protein